MPNNRIHCASQTMVLSLPAESKAVIGFARQTQNNATPKQYAKQLAWAYLRSTQQGQALEKNDSVNSFIGLAQLHEDLTLETSAFLMETVRFIYDDQPLALLLMPFASYRLEKANAAYQQAVLQGQPMFVITDLKHTIAARQTEFEAILQTV